MPPFLSSLPALRGHRALRQLAALGARVAQAQGATPVPGSSPPLASAPAVSTPRRPSPPSRLRRSLLACSREGMLAEVVAACSGAAILTAWGLHLGGSPLLFGILGALPFVGHLAQLPAAFLTARFGPRAVALAAITASRQVYWPLVPLAFSPMSSASKQGTLVLLALVSAALAGVGNNAWVAWMASLVPGPLRGRYFGRRTALCTAAGALAALAAAALLDAARARGAEREALAALAGGGCVFGLGTSRLLARQHEPEEARSGSVLDELRAAFAALGARRVRALLAFHAAWSASVGLASSFYAVHLITTVGLGFVGLALHGAAVAAGRMLSAPAWGRAIDRAGPRPVLVATSFGIAGSSGLWVAADGSSLVPVALDACFSGVLLAGHGLAIFALPLACAPRAGRAFFLAAFAAAGGLSFALASALGGALAEALPPRSALGSLALDRLRVLFLLSTLARLGAAWLALGALDPSPATRPLFSRSFALARRGR